MEIKIFDNFLNKEDFREIESLDLPLPKSDELKIFREFLSKESLNRLNDNYHQKAINLLKELCPEKIKLYDYSDFHLILTGKNYKFPIHDDTPNKLLSCVIYIYPNNNCGTILYENKKGHGKKIIEWKQNRNLIFSRIERKTWHSFESDGVSDRVALVYNLMTTQIKKVYKIEKKSYLIGKFRWKINPYLYNYFKFTI